MPLVYSLIPLYFVKNYQKTIGYKYNVKRVKKIIEINNEKCNKNENKKNLTKHKTIHNNKRKIFNNIKIFLTRNTKCNC